LVPVKDYGLPPRYEAVRLLGSGGMADVVLARDESLDEECALKIIHPRFARKAEVMARFRAELDVSRALRHPGIVEIRELGEPAAGSPGPSFLSMEYLSGGDLKRRILRAGKLPLAEILRIARACLEALAAAHRAGIVHRDLKPQNVLFRSDGSPLISDFGLARVGAEALLADGLSLSGTPDYCPPEMIRGDRADVRADLYSFGATLFEAAAGRPPFIADSPYALLRLKSEGKAPSVREFSPELPEWFSSVLAQALEVEPIDRFQTADAFLLALGAREGRIAFIPDSASQTQTASPARASKPDICPRCGRAVPRSLGRCLDCGLDISALRPASDRASSHRVVVIGPGKPGDKLDHGQRDLCLRVAEREGVDVARLRKSIPRVPFTLATSLSASSAASVARALSDEGLDAVAVGPESDAAETRRAKKAELKKVLSLLPRIYLIILSSGGFYFNNLWRALVLAPAAIPIVLGIAAAAPFAVLLLSGRRSYAKIEPGSPIQGDPPLLPAARAALPRNIQGPLAAIARKADALAAAIPRAEGLSVQERAELESALDEALRGVAASLAEGVGESLSGPDREDERRLEACSSALLSCSAALDSAVLGLSGAEASRALLDLRALETSAREAGDIAAGLREISGGNHG
jgi:serine/threonine protein kinase